jgi:hypothetical protein
MGAELIREQPAPPPVCRALCVALSSRLPEAFLFDEDISAARRRVSKGFRRRRASVDGRISNARRNCEII